MLQPSRAIDICWFVSRVGWTPRLDIWDALAMSDAAKRSVGVSWMFFIHSSLNATHFR